MSFHSDFLTQLKADIVTALGIASAQVLHGRSPQKVTHATKEVWVEAVDVQHEGGGLSILKTHQFRVHVRHAEKREGNLTGAAQLDTVRADLETLRLRWNGARNVNGSNLTSNLVCLTAVEDRPDADPAEQDLLDGSLLLSAVER